MAPECLNGNSAGAGRYAADHPDGADCVKNIDTGYCNGKKWPSNLKLSESSLIIFNSTSWDFGAGGWLHRVPTHKWPSVRLKWVAQDAGGISNGRRWTDGVILFHVHDWARNRLLPIFVCRPTSCQQEIPRDSQTKNGAEQKILWRHVVRTSQVDAYLVDLLHQRPKDFGRVADPLPGLNEAVKRSWAWPLASQSALSRTMMRIHAVIKRSPTTETRHKEADADTKSNVHRSVLLAERLFSLAVALWAFSIQRLPPPHVRR